MELIEQFAPPDGTRLIWHSPKAKAEWEPRIQRISSGQSARERLSVATGIRNLCLQPISQGLEYERLKEWTRNHGLALMPIRAVGRFDGFAHRYTAGNDMYIVAIARNREYAEDPKPEQFLGYPLCCQEFFFAHFPRYIDPMWQWAGGQGSERQRYVHSNVYCNPLLRYWSLRFCPHIPCGPTCWPSIRLGQMFAELMREEERAWLEELLSGPIRWSCLHGVAEVHTEHFRIILGSNPSRERYEVTST